MRDKESAIVVYDASAIKRALFEIVREGAVPSFDT